MDIHSYMHGVGREVVTAEQPPRHRVRALQVRGGQGVDDGHGRAR